ncbi:hydrogen gas-evolving membrane-bound hydrogenase subunit E [Wenzhouxiangella limi]|uniref:Sodium:proton antiporter n=1 Tax=Wenzhouxiangella limi TaxID=2707351 RepID=A0A845URH9_9GAMM|nr:hydrogen gas-evolving membrane-bound hydrogenase subunit E [Wenzhouxiangella limi]NDY94177.1 sodium:proton antiporter [Wenzhouxiangella limi]
MRSALALVLVVVLAALMMAGVSQLPPPGEADQAVHRHVAANYLADGVEEGGTGNRVTAVLLDYRALDTYGEVVVIFAALIAVLLVRSAGGPRTQPPPRRVPVSPVVDQVIRLMTPFIALFALFMIIEGHVLPGGGFQGGVVLGALMILLSLALGPDRLRGALHTGALFWLRAVAPLAFTVSALAGLGLVGWWFALPEPGWMREFALVLLELAIGFGGAAALTGFFLSLEEDIHR